MPVWRQSPWVGQPQFAAPLDKGHPACPDLGVWLPTAGQRNGVSGASATIVNSGVGFIGGRGGVGYTTSGQTLTATNGNGLDTGVTTLPSQLTLICQFISYDSPSSAAAFGGPVLKDQYGINWHHSNAAYRGAFTVHIGAAYPAILLADTTANKLHTVVGVWDGAQITLFQNGAYVGSASASGTLNATNSNAFSINVAAGTRYPFNGQVFLATLGSKAIDDSLARDLSINPWQIFAPIPRRLFDAGAASGSYTLAAENAAWQFAAQDAALKVARKLSAANAPWEFAAQNAGLKVARKIIADNAAWNFAAQDATLTYAPAGAYVLTAESTGWQFAVPDATLTLSRSGGGGYEEKKKRKFIAKVGDKLVVFNSADKALNAIQQDDQEPDAPIVVKPKKPLPKDAVQVQSIPVEEIKSTARMYDHERQIMQMFERQRYAEMLVLYEALKRQEDEDEVEILMLT